MFKQRDVPNMINQVEDQHVIQWIVVQEQRMMYVLETGHGPHVVQIVVEESNMNIVHVH